MKHEGGIAVPNDKGKKTNNLYYVETYARKNKNGLSGGKIRYLKLTREGETIAEFNKGWILKPNDQIGLISVQILEMEYNS